MNFKNLEEMLKKSIENNYGLNTIGVFKCMEGDAYAIESMWDDLIGLSRALNLPLYNFEMEKGDIRYTPRGRADEVKFHEALRAKSLIPIWVKDSTISRELILELNKGNKSRNPNAIILFVFDTGKMIEEANPILTEKFDITIASL